jgi:sugar lactone lactonase YvrE
MYIADAVNIVVRKISTAGVITRVAGTGVAGYNGDGILATTAQVNQPFDVIVGADGSVYFGECGGHRIRKVSPAGIISTIAGNGVAGFSGDGGLATAARVSGPGGLCFDHDGNLYIADGGNHRIRKISAAGIITTIAGNGLPGYSGDGVAATATKLYYAGYLCMDPAGNLYVSDNGNHRIRKIDPSGIITTVAGNGVGTYAGDGGPATAASIYFPAGINMDASGNLYIADYSNHRVRKVAPSGTITTFAGTGVAGFSGDGGPATAAKFDFAVDVELDACGTVYIGDMDNHRVRKIEQLRPLAFDLGTSITITLCADTYDSTVNGALAVRDTDQCQTETWSLISVPTHGTISGMSASATSNGGIVYPAGIIYTPATGYMGHDTLVVQVSDGTFSDTMMVYVNIDSTADAGAITGADSVCVGSAITLTDAVAGGTWGSLAPAIGAVSTTGIVSGISIGTVGIHYVKSVPCGTDSAMHTVTVHNGPSCYLSLESLKQQESNVVTYPNPSNGTFTIRVEGLIEAAPAILTDVTGRIVSELYLQPQKDEVVTIDSAKGIFYLSVQLPTGRVQKKVIIE